MQEASFSVLNLNQVTLRGKYYQSDKKDNHRVIIISHGFNSSMETSKRYVEPFVKLGFTVFTFDFMGNGTSDGDSVNDSVLTEKSDLLTIVKYVKQNYQFKKLILMGCSQGGLVSALVANNNPKLINDLILFYPAFSIPSDLQHGHVQDVKFNKDKLPDRLDVHGRIIGRKYIKDGSNIDIWDDIGNFRRPTLVCHANTDQVVPFKYAEKGYSIYKNAQLVTIKNGDHGFKEHGYHDAMIAATKFVSMN